MRVPVAVMPVSLVREFMTVRGVVMVRGVVAVVLVFHGIPSVSSRSHSPVIESEEEPQGAAVEARDYRQCTLIV